jgi:hypothetical protein
VCFFNNSVFADAAMRLVPKSGELWCEIGRSCARQFDWSQAERCFRFAMEFTPQYGDCFLEHMQMQLARLICSRIGCASVCADLTGQFIQELGEKWDTSECERACIAVAPNHGELKNSFVDWFYFKKLFQDYYGTCFHAINRPVYLRSLPSLNVKHSILFVNVPELTTRNL